VANLYHGERKKGEGRDGEINEEEKEIGMKAEERRSKRRERREP